MVSTDNTKLYGIKQIINIDIEPDYEGFAYVLDRIIETKYAGEQEGLFLDGDKIGKVINKEIHEQTEAHKQTVSEDNNINNHKELMVAVGLGEEDK